MTHEPDEIFGSVFNWEIIVKVQRREIKLRDHFGAFFFYYSSYF